MEEFDRSIKKDNEVELISGWESRLVEDCKHIVWVAELGVFRKWHEFGSRILKDEGYLTKKYGDSYAVNLAEKIDISERSLWYSLQFVKKYPDWKEVEEILHRDALSWREFKAKMLPDNSNDGNEEFNPQLYNVWNFQSCDERFGLKDFEGKIPGQIIQNVLYYFTDENALVVDPMAGGGTTLDVCLAMNRKVLCYDLNPTRVEIVQNDIMNGFPDECKNCDLIFLDPPYFNMVFEGLYKDVDDFYLFIEKLARNCWQTVKKGGIVALLMADMTEKGQYCLSGECYRRFIKQGFKCIDHVSAPESTEQFLPQQVEYAKKEKHLLGRNRDLYIFRKK